VFSGLPVELLLVRLGACALQRRLELSLDPDEARVLHRRADAARYILGTRTRAFWLTMLELVSSGLEIRSILTRARALWLQGIVMHS